MSKKGPNNTSSFRFIKTVWQFFRNNRNIKSRNVQYLSKENTLKIFQAHQLSRCTKTQLLLHMQVALSRYQPPTTSKVWRKLWRRTYNFTKANHRQGTQDLNLLHQHQRWGVHLESSDSRNHHHCYDNVTLLLTTLCYMLST